MHDQDYCSARLCEKKYEGKYHSPLVWHINKKKEPMLYQGVTRMAYSPRLWLMAIGW
jgi:hypothetical protein